MPRTGFLDRFNASMMNLGQGVSQGLQSFRKAKLDEAEEARKAEMQPTNLRVAEAGATAAEQTVQSNEMRFDDRLKKQQLENQVYDTSDIDPNEKKDIFQDKLLGRQVGTTAQKRKEWEIKNNQARKGQLPDGSPSSVREWEYYSQLGPEKQKAYLEMKRAEKSYMGNIQGVPTIVTPGTAGSKESTVPLSNLESEIDAAAAKAAAVESAKTTAGIQAGGEITPKEKKAAGQKKLTGYLEEMKGHFDDLREMGGIVDVEKGAISNIGSSASSSGLGQAIGTVTGSQAQSIRNKIKTMKPSLINSIREANPSIGAKGMDSEKELEFYLQSVGDEKRDYQSNIAALGVLNKAYGFGAKIPMTPEIQSKMDELKNEYKSSITEKDIDNMSAEELKKFLEDK